MFNKSDFIVEIPSTCIDCTLEIKACLLQSYINLARISTRQCMSLLSDSPHKIDNLVFYNRYNNGISWANQPKLSSWLGKCAPRKTVILLLSPSFVLKSNELRWRPPKSLFCDILHYTDAFTELWLILSMFSYLF